MADDVFDPTIERTCKYCEQRGCWRPVLLLQPGRDYTGRPFRFQLGLVVCGQHRKTKADEYLTEGLWNDILAWFRARKMGAGPHRPSTRLDHVEYLGDKTEERALAESILQQVEDPVERVKHLLRGYAGRLLTDDEQERRDKLRFELRKAGVEHARAKMRQAGFQDDQYEIVDKTTPELLDAGRFRCDVRFTSRELTPEQRQKSDELGLVPIRDDDTTA